MDLQAIEQQIQTMKNQIILLETELQKLKTPSKQESNISDDAYIKVTKLMQEMQIPANLYGYRYIRTAVMMICEEETLLDAVVKALYPSVAKVHRTTANKVERAIRHAIETAWDKPSIHSMKRVFGTRVFSVKPTNSEFLAAIVDYLRLNESNRIVV